MNEIKDVNRRFIEEMIKWKLPYRALAFDYAVRLKKIAIKLGFTKTQAHILAFQTTLGTFTLLRHENTLSPQ